MDAPQVDVDEAIDSMPKVLRAPFRKFIKQMMSKAGKPADDKEADKADEEREALSDLHEETKGKPKSIPVMDEDLPFNLGGDEESEDEESQASDEDKPKPAKKRSK